MAVPFETVRELRYFFSLYNSTLQSFEDFSYVNSSRSSDYESELSHFSSRLTTEDIQVLTLYLHIGNRLLENNILLSSMTEEEVFTAITLYAIEVGCFFYPETDELPAVPSLMGYPNDDLVFEKLRELTDKFSLS